MINGEYKEYKKVLSAVAIVFFANTWIICREFTQDELNRIFTRHCAGLKNVDVIQQPLIITFSGTPGMGKSFIAKKLEDVYCAVRISTDELRPLFDEMGATTIKEHDYALQQYLLYFFAHFKMPNKRFILDASIDRKYTQLFFFCKKHTINLIVIRLDVPRDIITKRLYDREGDKVTWYLKHLDAMFLDYHKFAESYKDYILFTNIDGASLIPLFQEIDKKIACFDKA